MTRTVASTLPEALAEIFAMEVPLRERLAAYSSAMRRLNSPFVAEYDQLVRRLAAGEAGSQAPGPGDRMPPFLLTDPAGSMVSLEAVLAEGPAVISFNRGHWCPFCALELEALAAAQRSLAALGARIVSIMPEHQTYTAPLQARFGDRIVVLTDLDNAYALSLGLAMWVGDGLRALMAGRGWSLDLFQGNAAWLLPLPATFVVGGDGLVRARFVDPDFRNRMDLDAILAALA
ncbi:redoxin domain-containing protein [Prosthecomicrobium sp. N25]|uniref:redoxin domain-containing protein n=1 Tax=Prosthecomicrobium sp. N25 TaxID=3129254 RepID=UPI00307842A7